MKVAKILFALINTGLALFVGYWIFFGLRFGLAGWEQPLAEVGLYIQVFYLLTLAISVVAGWVFALRTDSSLWIKIIAVLGIPIYLQFAYVLLRPAFIERMICTEVVTEEGDKLKCRTEAGEEAYRDLPT